MLPCASLPVSKQSIFLRIDCRNYEALEDASACCLDTLITVLQDEGNENHQDNLLMMLKGLLKGISAHGLSALRSDKLKVFRG